MRAIYFMDDFFSLDFPFGNFSLQFMDGSVWLFDEAQAARVPQEAFRRCAESVCVPSLRYTVRLTGSTPAAQVAELARLTSDTLRVVVASEDSQALELAKAHGLETRTGLRAFQEEMVDRMMNADILFASMNADGALLEDLVADALPRIPCTAIDGETVQVTRVHHLAIDFSNGEEEGFAIYPDHVDLDKHFDVTADYVKPNGTLVEQGPLRVRVRAVYRIEGEHGYFTIASIEG